ncbi:type I-E CRISPR-associated protein Cas5/CasD (plasmid) [Streptomyces sp. NBC_00464]|uniref:type I-E CRISPR-associated protein Cas5/CasD n=1 Tax=Streptomyces sp. NBC_00464 TaxID=2975751 RepID=UPI002E179A41
MNGLLLRLAGPLQSWGERSAFTPTRETAPFPTRSGLLGMFAAAEGRPRTTALADNPYDDVVFTVRADRPGTLLTDFHTAGGGLPDPLTAATSGGKHKGAAVITRRDYLTDAVFVIAVQAPDTTLNRITQALTTPHWAPYLGRRSCIPDEPLLLRPHCTDPVTQLLHHVPLSPDPATRVPTDHEDGTVPVRFYWETPPPHDRGQETIQLSSYDQPVSFTPHARAHARRTLYRTTEHLPARLLTSQTGTGNRPSHQDTPPLQERLISYALNTQETVA